MILITKDGIYLGEFKDELLPADIFPINFEFDYKVYNNIYDVKRSYYGNGFIYLIGEFHKAYKNQFPSIGSEVKSTYNINKESFKIEED